MVSEPTVISTGLVGGPGTMLSNSELRHGGIPFPLVFSSEQSEACARPRSGARVGSGARMVQVPHRST